MKENESSGAEKLFRNRAEDYIGMVDWPARLLFETPFYIWLFDRIGLVASDDHVDRRGFMLDVGCGPGKHAMMFAKWGYDSAGIDISPEMIAYARQEAKDEDVSLRFEVGGFESIHEIFGNIDLVICVGNVLAALNTPEMVRTALKDMAKSIPAGGYLLLQTLNYRRIFDKGDRFFPVKRTLVDETEILYWKFFDFLPEGNIRINLAKFVRIEQPAKPGEIKYSHDVHSTEIMPVYRSDMQAWLEEAGFGDLEFYGAHGKPEPGKEYAPDPFDENTSRDMIILARRRS